MIDFVKIVITNPKLISILWNNPLLEYHSEIDKRVSIDEIRKVEIHHYKNLKFIKHYNRIEITGSLHYYFNNGLHNANDFKVEDCINTILELENDLRLNLKNCDVVNLEFGVNIIIPFPVEKLIPWLKYHERNEFRYYPNLKYAKQSSSFNLKDQINQYKIIKAYAKGFQVFEGYEIENKNLFRFEVKSKKGRYIKEQLGIQNLYDLTNTDTYQNISDILIKEWNKVLVFDKLNTFKKQSKINKYLSSDFWDNVLQGHRNSFTYHKNRYHQLLESNPNNIRSSIRELISQKLDQLKKDCAISPTIKKEEIVQFHRYIRGECEQNRICKVTGLSISMQKDDSFLLSHTGLKYYHEYDSKIYEIIKREFLSDQWINSDYETQIKEIAHNIRNHWNNLKLRQIRLYPPHQIQFNFIQQYILKNLTKLHI